MRFIFPYVPLSTNDLVRALEIVPGAIGGGFVELKGTQLDGFGLNQAWQAFHVLYAFGLEGNPAFCVRDAARNEDSGISLTQRDGSGWSAQLAGLLTLAWHNRRDTGVLRLCPGLWDTEALWLTGAVNLRGQQVLVGTAAGTGSSRQRLTLLRRKLAAFCRHRESRFLILPETDVHQLFPPCIPTKDNLTPHVALPDAGQNLDISLSASLRVLRNSVISFGEFSGRCADPDNRLRTAKAIVSLRCDELTALLDLLAPLSPKALAICARTRAAKPKVSRGATSPNNLMALPNHAIKRVDKTAEIMHAFAERSFVCISGLSGTGKTFLARAYAQTEACNYPGGVWWIDARETPTNALNRLRVVLAAHGPAEMRQSLKRTQNLRDREGIADAVRMSLELVEKPSLLILDGVESDAWLGFRPSGSVKVLQTTSDTRYAFSELTINAGMFSLDEARQLCDRVSPIRGALQEACRDRVIRDLLCCYPLGVALAASATSRAGLGLTWHEYEVELTTNLSVLDELPNCDGYPNSLSAAIGITLHRGFQRSHSEALLIGVAVFTLSPIPLDWAVAAAGLQNEIDKKLARSELRSLHLVQETGPDEAHKNLQIHALVLRKLRECVEAKYRDKWRAAQERFIEYVAAGRVPHQLWFARHILTIFPTVQRLGLHGAWLRMYERQDGYLKRQFARNTDLAMSLVEAAECALGPRHPDVAIYLILYAKALIRADQVKKALDALSRALELREDANAADPLCAELHKELSELYGTRTQPLQLRLARLHLQEAIGILEELHGVESTEVLSERCKLAKTMCTLEEFSDSRPLLDQIVSCDPLEIGNSSWHFCIRHLAAMLPHDDAERLLIGAIRTLESVDTPPNAVSELIGTGPGELVAVAELYADMGRDEDAHAATQKAREAFSVDLANDASMMIGMSYAFHLPEELTESPEAMSRIERNVEALANIFPSVAFSLAASYQLANVLIEVRDFTAAREYLDNCDQYYDEILCKQSGPFGRLLLEFAEYDPRRTAAGRIACEFASGNKGFALALLRNALELSESEEWDTETVLTFLRCVIPVVPLDDSGCRSVTIALSGCLQQIAVRLDRPLTKGFADTYCSLALYLGESYEDAVRAIQGLQVSFSALSPEGRRLLVAEWVTMIAAVGSCQSGDRGVFRRLRHCLTSVVWADESPGTFLIQTRIELDAIGLGNHSLVAYLEELSRALQN